MLEFLRSYFKIVETEKYLKVSWQKFLIMFFLVTNNFTLIQKRLYDVMSFKFLNILFFPEEIPEVLHTLRFTHSAGAR